MQIFLETKEAKATLQKRRNLFGLGLTSLIAACGTDKAAGGGSDNSEGPGDPDTLPFKAAALTEAIDSDYTATVSGTDSLTVEIEKANADTAALIFSEAINTNTLQPNSVNIHKLTTAENQYDLVISSPTIDKNPDSGNNPEYRKGKMFIYWDVASVTGKDSTHLEIKGAAREDRIGIHAPDFLQIAGTDNKYDMIIRSHSVDKDGNGALTDEGAIYILWDIADYKTTASIILDGGDTNIKDSGLLTIKGVAIDDNIGTYAPDFLQIAGVAGEEKLDMVIRSNAAEAIKGAIYILWDVDNYWGNKTAVITLDGNGTGVNTESGLLTIKGAITGDRIGIHAPEFLQLGGVAGEEKLDMVIRSYAVDNGKGAIYILWDVASYGGNKTAIALDGGDMNINDAGLLTIKGAITGDKIGTHAPDFLQIGGADNKYDMVIRSQVVDDSKGAIYILWDVEDYKTATITLDASVTAATSGSLAICGAKEYDRIGIHAPDFLQLGGTDNNYDMVIRSEWADNITGGSYSRGGKGAIYILWDVEDYYKDGNTLAHKKIDLGAAADPNYATSGLLTIKGVIADKEGGSDSIAGDQIGIHAPEFVQLGKENDKYDMIIRSEHVDKSATEVNTGAIYVLWDVGDYAGGNETINLTSLSSDASSGLLTIYGTAGSMLGSSNILYRADSEDSDVDGDGTNDLVFENGSNTYVLFGDKVATTTGTGVDEKVDSKTIDLANIGPLVDKDGGTATNNEGFFSYDFDGAGSAEAVDRVGYRFANRKEDLAAVQDAYDAATSAPLSNTDADLAVWDIA